MPLDQEALDALRLDRRGVDAAYAQRARPWVYALLGLVVLLAALLAWWWTRPVLPELEVVTVNAERSASPAGGAVLSASGYVVARRLAIASSKVTGQVSEVLIEEGMAVRAGQVLARLDDSTVRKQLALAESQVETARRALTETEVRLADAERSVARTASLREQNLASQQALDTAEADRNALRARLDTARSEVEVATRVLALRRQDLEDTVIRAPFSGIVVSKNAQRGEMISPVSAGGGFTSTGIGAIVDMTSLEIEVDVNEAYINRVSPGMRVEAVLDAYPDWRIGARVINVVPTADRQKATVRVRVGFDALDPRILPDMGVQVQFIESAAPADAGAPAVARPRLPSSAVVERDGRSVVFVVGGDGAVERRAVAVAAARAGLSEVQAGLSGGERVVLNPPDGLQDGDRIRIQER
jgi:RND family efflux transporter MFP subunit